MSIMSRQKEDPVFNRVEELRLAKGLTRQQLADAVGVHYQTVGYLERGEYSPSLVLALKIAAALEAEVAEVQAAYAAMGVTAAASRTGQAWLAQNWDWMGRQREALVLLQRALQRLGGPGSSTP